MKTLAFILSALLLNFTSGNTCFECNEKTYQAYLGAQNPEVAKQRWKKVIDEEQAKFDSKPDDIKQRYALALSQFGLLSATMRDKDEDLFDQFVDKTEESLE